MVDVNMILSQNSLDFTENYNGADDIKCSISMTEFEARCKAIGISPHNTLDPHRTEIRITANGVVKAFGEVMMVTANLGTELPTLDIKASGWLASFNKRYISDYDYVYAGMTHAQIARQVVLDSQYGVNLLRQNITPANPNYSLLPNIRSEYFGFEYGTSGYNMAGWVADNTYGATSGNTITLDTSTASDGKTSLNVTQSGTNNAGVYFLFTGNSTAANFNALTISQGGLQVMNRNYILKFMVNKANANGQMGYGLITASGSTYWGQIPTNNATGWQLVTIQIPEPPNPVTGLIIQTRADGGGQTNFNIDHVWFCRDGQLPENRKFWIDLGIDTASANQSPTMTRSWDNQQASTAITGLTRLSSDQFDFDFTLSADGKTRYFNVYSSKGSAKPNIEVVQSINNTNPVANVATSTVVRDATTLYNYVHAIGSGSGVARLENHEWSPQSEQVYRRRDDIKTFNGTTLQPTLVQDAISYVQYYDYIYNLPKFTMAPGSIDRNSISVGDTIYVEVTGSTFIDDLNNMYQIYSIETRLDQGGNETLILTFNPQNGAFSEINNTGS